MKTLRPLGSLLVTALLVGGAAAPTSAGTNSRFGAENGRYQIGEAITIRFENNTDHEVRMGKIWRIGAWQTDQEVASYYWPDAERTVAPGDERVWTWHQLGPACYGECQNLQPGEPVSPGEQVDAGKYVVLAPIGGRQRQDTFLIGSYFTLGFEGRENLSFVVFVAKQPEVDQMAAEAEAEDKTLIVGGIVRRGRAPYNPAWSYTMGPRSILLGEVWIEVCDGSPRYVERHLNAWAGEMWCPWSSYVARAGF
jgi:hypothetical protein